MSKSKKIAISFLVAACAVFVSLAFVACGKSSVKKSESSYGHGEEGWYYYEATSSTEYLMSLQSGVFMISEASSEGYVGTYAFSEDDKTISFMTNDGETFDANFADDAMQIEITGTRPYTFLRKVDYTVTFKDGSATVGTQSVTYGKRATSLDGEKDGFVFLGWYTDETYTTAYKFDTGVTGDLSLYAYYIEIDPSATNYEVQFISEGKVISTVKTVNGVVLDSYFPEVSGVAGWWVSDTNEESELTYKYDGETLYENTKLFAVEGSALYASVYDDKVTWETEVASVAIFVDGTAIASTARGGSFSYDFSSLSAGKHTVTLTSAAGDEELTYVSHGLKRVSTFAVYGNVLVYNAVENAQYYYISVECGNSAHDHSMVYNGNTLTYDFSGCEMAEDGIKFTVYAYAQGWKESVSDTFVYLLKMDRAEVTIDSSSDTATWAPVYDITGETLATGYEIYINGEYVVTTLNPGYSFKSYNLNDSVTIEVKPLAPGYYSEKSEAASYTKSTLAAPEITEVSAYSITWSEVSGATNYIIYVNGKQIETVESGFTTYDLYDDPDFVVSSSYVITVRAVSGTATQNSQLSDEIVATDSEMAPLLVYENGIVYWQYALAADTYYVTVSRGEDVGDETAVTGQNSFHVTFMGSGENLITVYFKTTEGESAKATLSVTAYAIIFNSEGGETIETLYVAKGDTLNLETPEYPAGDATFLGWYTLPDPDGSRVVSDYAGDGVLIESGSVFSGNSALVLYACWEAVKINIVLNAGSHGDVGGATSVDYQMALNVAKYTLPVPESNDAAYVFYGWYSGENGTGTRYTYYDGSSRTVYTDPSVTTLHAYWIEVLSFSETEYAGETFAEVSKGANINLAPNGEVTVPATYTIDGVELTVGVINSGAFGSCSSLVTLNIPDTVVYISTTNNGYSSGSGAFALSGSLSAVNVYATGDGVNTTREIIYYSEDGILFEKDGDGVRLVYYPWGNRSGSVVIPESVSNEYEYEISGSGKEVKVVRAVTSIAGYAFNGNTAVTSVTIPATVSLIDTQTFGGCAYLSNVYFNEVVMSGEVSAAKELTIAEYAFNGCTRLEAVTLPSRLTTFDTDAFSGCTRLTSVSVETGGTYTSYEGILYRGENVLVYCPRGKTEVVWKNAVTRIEDKAFENCTFLTYLVIPTSVTYIGKSAFEGCTAVTGVDFQDRLEANPLTIDERAFYGCTWLTGIVLPLGLETLGYQAFAGCTRLLTVEMDCRVGTTASDLDFAEGAFGPSVTTVIFGENVPLMENFVTIFGRDSLLNVKIDSQNSNYIVDDDCVIYGVDSADVILLWSPSLGTGIYSVLDGTTRIASE
ncbi:MAG: leucine-rich repeat protein, partial [Bacteroidales bacterium]|nr:leucine-rich repeat protein [Bacteroidales bacterium]